MTDQCKFCRAQIHWDGKTWVDNSGGDVCGWGTANDPHEPYEPVESRVRINAK